MPETTTYPLSRPQPTEPVLDVDPGWKVLLYNDEVHDLLAVVFALQRAAGLSIEVAEMVAFEAHSEGEAVVKRGLSEEDALIICGGLKKWTRIEGQTDGVDCEVVKDDG